MNRIAISSLTLATAALALSGSAFAKAQSEKVQLVAGGAELSSRLDSESAKAGEMIMARLTQTIKTSNGMKLPDGTELLGHVDQAQALSGNRGAELALTFDKAKMKDGKLVPIKATLVEVAPEGAELSPPDDIMANSQYIQEAGTLKGVSMKSAVTSNISGTLMSKHREIHLQDGTELEIAVAPKPAA